MSSDTPKTEPERYDVFLCHNSEDKPEIRRIADDLIRLGILPWLDEREILPGSLWQSALEDQIASIKSAAIFVGKSGIGPWQNMEIRAFINEFVERQCAVIPVFLASVEETPNLPILLKNFHAVDFRKPAPDPLQQLLRGIKGEKIGVPTLLADAPAAKTTPLPEQPDLRVYHPLAEAPPEEQQSQLLILLDRVKEMWIDGVLKQSLNRDVCLALGKAVKDDAVETPWHRIIELPKQRHQIAGDTPIETVFDATGLLIILGEPGCGKTTTLLQLAENLIKRAQASRTERIPVILNLSRWEKSQPLSEWMADSLHKLYNVPTKLAQGWLAKGYLVPLLDGLDELSTEHQADCVEAINTYIDQAEPRGLVVCSRLMEYQWLPERLKMNGAVCIELLSREQIDGYFNALGDEFESLRTAVKEDAVLLELAKSPLMLNIMSIAYQPANQNSLIAERSSLEARRAQIFDTYVDTVFQRKESLQQIFSRDQVMSWLMWLARKMRENSQSSFFIEDLQPIWLDSWKQRIAYREVSSLNFGVIVGIVSILVALSENEPKTEPILDPMYGLIAPFLLGLLIRWDSAITNGTICGLFFSLIGILQKELADITSWLFDGVYFGLIAGVGIGTLNSIKTVERMTWSWNLFFNKFLIGASVSAFSGGVASGLIYGLNYGLMNGMEFGLFIGLLCGILGGMVNGIAKGFIDKIREDKIIPNQGIRLTLTNGLFVSIMAILIIGLVSGLFFGATDSLKAGLVTGLIVGLSNGLIIGLNRGLATVIKHYSLRLVLWRSGKIPFKIPPFLDYCAKLILLKKVGGGYIFIHRMLLEYFAKLETSESNAVAVKTHQE
ncbi:MAG: TIR domain-containing protein [Gammaproteobacteria bacterium]